MRRPRDVCPDCGARGCVRADERHGGNVFLRPYRCPACGAVHAFCDLKRNTPEEAAEALELKRAYKRKWYAENREHALAVEKRRRDENRDAINRKARVKWRTDPEFRAKKLAASAEYGKANKELRRAISARYYEGHRYQCALACKLSRLRRWRRDQACQHPQGV